MPHSLFRLNRMTFSGEFTEPAPLFKKVGGLRIGLFHSPRKATGSICQMSLLRTLATSCRPATASTDYTRALTTPPIAAS